jgi:mannosylglycerate hydrolase
MEVPAFGYRANKGIEGNSERSVETKMMIIITEFTLCKGDKKLHVKTTINNVVESHRMRLFLPTRIQAEFTRAEGHFIVENRRVEPVKNSEGDYYPGMQTLPMQAFVDISDQDAGFALITNSIGEYEMLRDKNHTLALTLFRSVENRICSEYRASGYFPDQKGGQSLRTMTFDYAIMPHSGDWKEAEVARHAREFNVSPLYYQFSPGSHGELPVKNELFSIASSVIGLSALKKSGSDSALILRIYNPTEKETSGEIKFNHTIDKVFETNLKEDEKFEIPISGGTPFSESVNEKSKPLLNVSLNL